MKRLIFMTALLSSVLLSGCSTSKTSSTAEMPSTKQPVADSIVSSNVKTALTADADLASTKIAVETVSGTVILRGEIKSMVLRKKVEAIVKDIDGVKAIDNRLVITG